MNIVLFCLFSYLIGSLNGAQMIHHRFRARFPGHITSIGTRNAGAQNVWMSIGKMAGTVVFIFDFLKGFAVILLGRFAGFEGATLVLFGAVVITGHNWPVFFHFRGGRGFAALIGTFYGFSIPVAVIASLISLPFGIARVAGITPFVFLVVGSFALFPAFGLPVVLMYFFTSVILFARRVHAEWVALRAAKNKMRILKNLFLYDRATSKPPSLKELFS